MDVLRAVKRAQLSLSDEKGASATTEKMAQEAVQFRQGIAAGVAAVAKDTDLDPELAKYAKALNLILNAQDKSEAAQKEAVGQAAILLGNDAQKVEALMLIANRFAPENQAIDVLRTQIEKHNFSGAMTTIQSMKGLINKDELLWLLAGAEARDNQFKLAFDTASSIADAGMRARTLRDVLPVKRFQP